MHGTGSRNKLTPSHARLYPGDSLLDVLGRALCTVHCLPRKELHEAWELSTRVRRRFRGGRVVDLCCGQGLVAWCMLLLDDTSLEAVAVDVALPGNHEVIAGAVVAAFPRLQGRVRFVRGRLETVPVVASDVVVSAHACGDLTDAVLAQAVDAGARVAVLPCCHRTRRRVDLEGDVEARALAIDRERVAGLRERGLVVEAMSIPVAVSPKNRLIVAAPAATTSADDDDDDDDDPWA